MTYDYFTLTRTHLKVLKEAGISLASDDEGDEKGVVIDASESVSDMPPLLEDPDILEDFHDLTPEELVSGLKPALEIILRNQTFEPGLYYTTEDEPTWEPIDVDACYEARLDSLDALTADRFDEYVADYRDNSTDAVGRLADEIIESDEVELAGHGRPFAEAIAERHLKNLSRRERMDRYAADPSNRLKRMVESQLGIRGKRASFFANAVERKGLLADPEDVPPLEEGAGESADTSGDSGAED